MICHLLSLLQLTYTSISLHLTQTCRLEVLCISASFTADNNDYITDKNNAYGYNAYGYNAKLLNSCIRLNHYSIFVSKVREYLAENNPLEVALKLAMDYCIDNDILSDILTKNREEVFNMLLTYYDEKLHEKILHKEVAESYEDKINLLNSTIAAKDSEIFVKDAALLESNAKISEMNAENGV